MKGQNSRAIAALPLNPAQCSAVAPISPGVSTGHPASNISRTAWVLLLCAASGSFFRSSAVSELAASGFRRRNSSNAARSPSSQASANLSAGGVRPEEVGKHLRGRNRGPRYGRCDSRLASRCRWSRRRADSVSETIPRKRSCGYNPDLHRGDASPGRDRPARRPSGCRSRHPRETRYRATCCRSCG